MPIAVVHALARLKAAAARANADLGVIDQGVAEAIAICAEEVAAGDHDGQFRVDVFQTGSGTSTNMNVNEVVAALATVRLGRPVHPNDDVNASQSSNDTVPTAIHVAAAGAVVLDLVPALWHLHSALERQALRHERTVKPGRTHLMDAVPVTLGQEMAGYAAQAALGVERLESTLPRVLEVPLGGTATGTGLNAPPGFATATLRRLADDTGLAVAPSRDPFEGQGARDALVELSGQLRVVAVGLVKICNDLRWMGSGPSAGLGEIRLPELQAGSSIMPGKVNPVVPEAVVMAATQVVGNDAAVTWAGAQGAFELNAMLPLLARDVLQSTGLLARSCLALADKVVDGLEVDVAALREAAERSPAIATGLNRHLGYDEVARIVKQSLDQHRSIRDVVLEHRHVDEGRITERQLAEALDVERLAGLTD
jgi:fumarate hydratase, class II